MLEQNSGKDAQAEEQYPGTKAAEEIQILDLHSKEPIVSYRNHIFRGTWCENIGTEMIFAQHDDRSPLPALRRLGQNIDLLAASSVRINFQEATLQPRDKDIISGKFMYGTADNWEDIPERYKRNGGIYVHIGGDKSGLRQPQAHFLEDLIALKRKRGETDEVTIQPLETRHNNLMVEDEEEERRRRKLQQDHARNVRWRAKRQEEREMGLEPTRSDYVPGKNLKGKFPRTRARRAVLISRDTGVISRYSQRVNRTTTAGSSTTPAYWNEQGAPGSSGVVTGSGNGHNG